MRYGLTISAVLGLVGSGVTTNLWAQAQPHQQVRLVGRVFDETQRLVEGVQVIVNRREVRAITDADGIFRLDVSPSDSTVGFRRIGYRPMLLTIRPLPTPRDTILVQLITSPVDLPEVIVSGQPTKPLRYAGTMKYDDVFLRQRVGLGTLITREAIDRRFGVATHEVLQGIPGIWIWNGPPKRIRFARCGDPRGVSVFIDGVRQVPAFSETAPATVSGRGGSGVIDPRQVAPRSFNPADEEPLVEMLSRVNPSDVEMIEVYRGPSEIPGVYHWDGCAVIAVWTRWNK
ncbi:MAG: carboxypeptidase-like regulatory domain-containing protein [Gemmatimonadetes bacterium]|nr:carboxypeptidase-like regulatory domain-containing protein [Gemmatimonadota bacterium]